MIKTENILVRLGAGVALGTAFLLVWSVLAVGYVGASGDPADLAFGGVLAVGVIGALVARFRPHGMARALAATALAHASVVAVAVAAGRIALDGHRYRLLGITGVFVALWSGSAWLFRRAARSVAGRRPVSRG